MKRLPGFFLLLLISSVSYADLDYYQAKVRGDKQSNLMDVVQAKTMAEARSIFDARYPGGQYSSVRRLDPEAGYEWYVARVTVGGQNAVDTTLAKNSGEARRVFTGRFQNGRIVSLCELRTAANYEFYESTIHSGDKTVEDVAFAEDAVDARKAFEVRYPDGRIGSLRKVK